MRFFFVQVAIAAVLVNDWSGCRVHDLSANRMFTPMSAVCVAIVYMFCNHARLLVTALSLLDAACKAHLPLLGCHRCRHSCMYGYTGTQPTRAIDIESLL
jgi:hypothetical protein